jgi:CBS domain-containing protein
LHKFGALPVVDDGKLVGIISVTDFLRYMASRE